MLGGLEQRDEATDMGIDEERKEESVVISDVEATEKDADAMADDESVTFKAVDGCGEGRKSGGAERGVRDVGSIWGARSTWARMGRSQES